jgi:hypothetical protein
MEEEHVHIFNQHLHHYFVNSSYILYSSRKYLQLKVVVYLMLTKTSEIKILKHQAVEHR